MRWNSLFAGLFAVVAPTTAWAGACCVGSTSTVPTRVGECELTSLGFGVGADLWAGRWDRSGTLRSAALKDDAVVGMVGIGQKIDREWQVSAQLPVRINHLHSDSASTWGGGAGDASLGFLWDPTEERAAVPGERRVPAPIITGGLRIPTGKDWTRSKHSMQQDVTGRGEWALSAGLSYERTLDKVPWSAGLVSEVGWGPGGALVTGTASASVGKYLGTKWSLLGTLRHQESWMVGRGSTARTALGAKLIRGQYRRWRAWAAVEADVPAPWLGRSATRYVKPSLGLAVLR